MRMNDLQQDFLRQSIENIENLVLELHAENNAGAFSENFSRRSFRALHTIKGTSQTFGFPASGSLAHELENLLSVAKNGQFSNEENCKSLLLEGLELLKKTFGQKNVEIPNSFLEKLRLLAPRRNDSETRTTELPDEIFSQLSNREKNVAQSAERAGKNLFCLEIAFDSATFAEGITNFREVLTENGEIIATLPGAKFNVPGKIDFQILLATAENSENIKNIAGKFFAEIVFQKPQNDFSNDLRGVFGQVAAHGKNLAKQLGREVDFDISGGEEKVSPKILKIVFDALLHLVRNAVDHAIEKPPERIAAGKPPRGQIKIRFSKEKNNFRLVVADDGRGIDAGKIRLKAIERNLISGDKSLSEQALLELIFKPEFSTAETLTEISGRGIGLDAVKDSIEKAGGEIDVESRKGNGTTFEILLPEES